MKSYSQIFLTILALALGFGLVMSGLFIGAYYYLAPGLPQAAELRDIKVQVPLQVYSRDGRLIDEFGELLTAKPDFIEGMDFEGYPAFCEKPVPPTESPSPSEDPKVTAVDPVVEHHEGCRPQQA